MKGYGYEGPIQKFIEKKFLSMDLDVDVFEPDNSQMEKMWGKAYVPGFRYEGRPNVVGTLKSRGDGRSLILNGHVDVVTDEPVSAWDYDPWEGRILDDKMIGRGTADMKGGLAAMIMAVDSLLESGVKPKGDILIQSVVSEEDTNNGTLSCITRGYKADAAIITEPTEFQVLIGHPGAMEMEITVKGKSGHQAYKRKLINAIDKTCTLLKILNEIY